MQIAWAMFSKESGGTQVDGPIFLKENAGIQVDGCMLLEKKGVRRLAGP